MKKWLVRGWPLVVWLLAVTALFRIVYATELAKPQYVGWCDQFPQGDEYYWQQHNSRHLTCAEMHYAPALNGDKPIDGSDRWWYVYIVGSRKEGVFSTREDAIAWANGQKLVIDPKQVR